MTIQEAIKELYGLQTECYFEAELYKIRGGVDGGKYQRQGEALDVALVYLMHSTGQKAAK